MNIAAVKNTIFRLDDLIKLKRRAILFLKNGDNFFSYCIDEEDDVYKLISNNFDKEFYLNKNDDYHGQIIDFVQLKEFDYDLMFYIKFKEYEELFIISERDLILYDKKERVLKDEWQSVNIIFKNYIDEFLNDSPISYDGLFSKENLILENDKILKLKLGLYFIDDEVDVIKELELIKKSFPIELLDKITFEHNTFFLILNYSKFVESDIGKSLLGVNKFNL